MLLAVEVRATILDGGKGVTVLSVYSKGRHGMKGKKRANYISEIFSYEYKASGILLVYWYRYSYFFCIDRWPEPFWIFILTHA